MIRFLILILLLWLLRPADLRADEGIAPLLLNDKEAVSHLYTRGELKGATRRAGTVSDRIFPAWITTIENLRTTDRLCGASLIEAWRKIPAPPHDPVDLLILWRNENRIDDLLFKILEEDLFRFGEAVNPPVRLAGIRPRDQARVAGFLEKERLKPEDLSRLLAPFKGRSPESPGCTLGIYRSLSAKHPDIPSMVLAGRVHRMLDDGAARLLLFYERSETDTPQLAVERYLDSLKKVKNREKPTRGTSRFLSEQPRKSGGFTRRELLYLRFDPTQIRMLTTVMKRLFTRMDSTRTDLVFTRQDGSTESIPLSPMGQYYFARKLLKRDLEELSRSFFFQGLSPNYEDLLTAALESGLIAPGDLDPLLEVDDLWNPDVPGWKRASDLAFRITGSASLFLPPPYNTLTSVTLVLLSGFIDRKTRTPSQGDPGYDPF